MFLILSKFTLHSEQPAFLKAAIYFPKLSKKDYDGTKTIRNKTKCQQIILFLKEFLVPISFVNFVDR